MLFLITKGLIREESYQLVQASAMKTWESIGKKRGKTFLENLYANKFVKKVIKKKELEKMFDNSSYTKHINYTFKKIFK